MGIAIFGQENKPAEEFPTWGWTGTYGAELTVNFRVEENRFRVYFIGSDNQLVKPDLERINARLNPRGDDPFFLPLNWDEDQQCYTHPRFIRRPYIFQTTLFLIGKDGEAEASYTFFLSQTGDNAEPKD